MMPDDVPSHVTSLVALVEVAGSRCPTRWFLVRGHAEAHVVGARGEPDDRVGPVEPAAWVVPPTSGSPVEYTSTATPSRGCELASSTVPEMAPAVASAALMPPVVEPVVTGTAVVPLGTVSPFQLSFS